MGEYLAMQQDLRDLAERVRTLTATQVTEEAIRRAVDSWSGDSLVTVNHAEDLVAHLWAELRPDRMED